MAATNTARFGKFLESDKRETPLTTVELAFLSCSLSSSWATLGSGHGKNQSERLCGGGGLGSVPDPASVSLPVLWVVLKKHSILSQHTRVPLTRFVKSLHDSK